jgi:hypothetical protein
MLHIKNISDEIASFVCLEKQPQSALKMLNMQTLQQYFRLENNKGLLFTMSWSGVVGFVLVLDHESHRRCCLWNEVAPTEGVHPLATAFYNLQFTI